jgi:hypothetical protein
MIGVQGLGWHNSKHPVAESVQKKLQPFRAMGVFYNKGAHLL